VFNLCLLLLVVTLAVPSLAQAQTNQRGDRDKLWNGMLIGAGIGAAVGMLIAPPAFCGGGHDTECAMIVRATIGLGSIAGGIGIGALVDGLMSSDATVPFGNGRPPSPRRGLGATGRPRLSGVQMSVRF
jgi:drug/metabolite transporter (DMT)-like permease